MSQKQGFSKPSFSGKSLGKSQKSKKSPISGMPFSSIGKIKEELDSEESEIPAKEELSEQILKIYQVYLKLLFGKDIQQSEEELLNISWGRTQEHNQEFSLPEAVLSFPNPDYSKVATFPVIKCVAAMQEITKIVKTDTSLDSQIFLKAIEGVFMKLRSRASKQTKDGQPGMSLINSALSNDQVISSDDRHQSTNQKKASLLNSNSKRKVTQLLQISQTDVVTNLYKKLEGSLLNCELNTSHNRSQIGNESNRRNHAQIINKIFECMQINFAKLKRTKSKQMTKGGYFEYVNNKWERTHKDTADYLTLLRNIILIILAKSGFHCNSFISLNGQYIYCALFAEEKNLKSIANQHQMKKQLNFWFSDIFSLEPVDINLRPLRLNNRLWKPHEYQLSPWFLYLRNMIVDLIERINFKRMSRETNLSHLNQTMFTLGKTDFNDDDVGPTEEEWQAFYSYLVHLEKYVNEVRIDYRIENDLASLLNKELEPYDIYVKRCKNKSILDGLNKSNVDEPQNQRHKTQIQQISNRVQLLIDSYSPFMIQDDISIVRYIKILKKENLAHNYMLIMKEALQIANTNRQKLLYTVWDRLNIDSIEPYVSYTIPSKGTSPALQACQMMCWCKYAINEDNKISLFSTTERIRLAYICINDNLGLNDLTSKGYVKQLFCLHSQYELFGHCNNFHNVMTSSTQFFKKQLFYLEEDWKIQYFKPWIIPTELINSYYGEKIGLYFCFSSYFVEMLSTQSLIGIGCNIVQWLAWDNQSSLYILITMVFAFTQIHWTNYLVDRWEQKQAMFNVKSGQMEKDEQVTKRSNFDGIYTRNIGDDDLNSVQQSTKELLIKLFLAGLLIILLLLFYAGIIFGLFVITQTLQSQYAKYFQSAKVLALEVSITATINILLLQFLGQFYDKICIALTDYENHSTVQLYETSFVVKKYFLQFFSYVGPLLFVTFLNEQVDLYCAKTNCETHVKYHFSCIVIWLTFIRLLKFGKMIYNLSIVPLKKYGNNQEDLQLLIENQASKQSYQISLERYGTLEDYLELFVQITLISLFGYTFPISYCMVYLQNIAQLWADRAKFLYLLQRPWPQTENSLGVWEGIMSLISYVCLLSNCGVITILYSRTYQFQLIMVYVTIFMGNCFIKFIINSIFGETPFGIIQLMKRQQYLLKSTIESFQKGSTSSATKSEVLQKWPLLKVYGTLNAKNEGDLETISSQDELSDYYILRDEIMNKLINKDTDQPQDVKEPVQIEINAQEEQLKKELEIEQQKTAKQAKAKSKLKKMKQQKKKQKEANDKDKSKKLLSLPQALEDKDKGKAINLGNPSIQIVKKHFQQRTSNWVLKFIYNPSEKKKTAKQDELLQILYKLELLSFHKIVWTEQRLNLRAYHLRRQNQLMRNLDYRKILIIQNNLKQLTQLFSEKIHLKYRKQLKPIENSTRPDDIAEFQALQFKQQQYTEKHTWISSRKLIVLKVKAVWFHQFRKRVKRQPAIKTMTEFYKRTQLIERIKPDSSIYGELEKLVDYKKLPTYTFEKFIDIITKLEISTPVIIQIPLTSKPISMINELSEHYKSPIFKSVVNEFKDTFVFDQQNTQLQQIVFQFFQEELFPITQLKLIELHKDNIWSVQLGNEPQIQLLKFYQIKHGEILHSFPKSNTNLGVCYPSSVRFTRLANIVDQIDSFTIKGYCAQVYPISSVVTLDKVIQYRKLHSLPYQIETITQFIFANLKLFTERPHGDICSKNYYYQDRSYILLYSEKSESDLLGLVRVVLEMIHLRPIGDLIEELLVLQHPLKDILCEMIVKKQTVNEVLNKIPIQMRFIEVSMTEKKKKKAEKTKIVENHQYIQEALFKIDFYMRMKLYDQANMEFDQFEALVATQMFDSDNSLIMAFCTYVDTRLSQYILSQDSLKIIRDLILICFYKVSLNLQTQKQFEEDANQLIESINNFVNDITTLLNCLCLNIKIEQLNEEQQNTLLKRRFDEKSQFLRLNLRFRIQILTSLRKHQSYVKVLRYHRKYCMRYCNQIRSLFSLGYYFQGNFGFALINIQEVMMQQLLIMREEQPPEILEEAVDLSPSQFNFDQVSPVEKEYDYNTMNQCSKNFNIQKLLASDHSYAIQYLVYQYLQLIMLHDDKDEQFQPRLYDFMELKLDDPTYKYLYQQLTAMSLHSHQQDYIQTEGQCEIGRYIVIGLNKWIEQFHHHSEIEFTLDLQYYWKQVMSYSRLVNNIKNKQALQKGLDQFTGETQLLYLMRIRIIQQLIHLSDYNLPIRGNTLSLNIENLSADIKLNTKLLELHTLHGLLTFNQESWFHHEGMYQFALYHYLTVCFAYSPKQFENILLEDTQLVDMANLAANLMSIKTDSHPAIMKKGQILQLSEQQLLVDDNHNSKQKYQIINSYLYTSLCKGRNLNKVFQKIKQMVKLDTLNPSIMVLMLVSHYINNQIFDMADVIITLSQKLLVCQAPIFTQAHEGFETDLKILSLNINHNNITLLAPYDFLVSRKLNLKYFADIQFYTQALLFHQFYSNNYEVVQEALTSQLSALKGVVELQTLNDICLSYLLFINSVVGDDCSDILKIITEFKYIEGTLIYALIQHFLCRYYINTNDFELAIECSKRVLNYIYSINLRSCIYVHQTYQKQTWYYNTKQNLIVKLIKPQLINCIPLDTDPLYTHLLDDLFIKQACLNHLDIISNLNEQLPPIPIIFQFLGTIDDINQQAYLLKVMSQYFYASATEEGLALIRTQLINNYKSKMKSLAKQKKKIVTKNINRKLLGKLQETDIIQYNNQINLLDYETSIYVVVTSGLTMTNIYNWSLQAAEKALQAYEKICKNNKMQMHPIIPELNMKISDIYSSINQIAQAIIYFQNAEHGFAIWFGSKRHPTKGLFFFKLALLKQWTFRLYSKWNEQLLGLQIGSNGCRFILAELFQYNANIISIFEQFQKTQDQDRLKSKLIGAITSYNKSFAEVTLVEQLVPAEFMRETLQLISIDLTGMQQLLDAIDIFTYFNQINQYFRDAKQLIDQLQQRDPEV